jgi:hypothetical protein
MNDRQHESELVTRLLAIEQQLTQQLSSIGDRIARIEDNMMLIPEIDEYKKLQLLLKEENWREADWETIRVIQAITGEPTLEDITPEDMRRFPCSKLQAIDRLWTNYSKGRFGFSVQSQIYQSVGGNLETTIAQDTKTIIKFGEKVGWREGDIWLKCDDLDYTLSAPIGCHPSRWWNSAFGSKMTNYFFNRLITCGI